MELAEARRAATFAAMEPDRDEATLADLLARFDDPWDRNLVRVAWCRGVMAERGPRTIRSWWAD